MALLLNIDTATEHASVCISRGNAVLALLESTEQKNHASFVQPAIQQLIAQAGLQLTDMDAVSVTAGPGSYTGLRVGLASAKGICFALGKPLILVGTLETMAEAVLSHYRSIDKVIESSAILCPMIDARRMEVFTAAYTSTLEEIMAPHALIIDPESFNGLLKDQRLIFSGTGHQKLKNIVTYPNAEFLNIQHSAKHLAARALMAYQSNRFADLAYSEPLYVKEFFNQAKAGTDKG
jgi:tRNA threonylcarbamoyladenosine biosynthesis protein TsaB